MPLRVRASALVVLLLSCALVVAAQDKPAGDAAADSPFKGLKYRSIGPAAGGRATRVAGRPGDPSTFYVAAASGGVWQSTDAGASWTPIFDDQPISSIGSIAVAPSDPNVIYVGSGEANIRGNVAAGNGIYKSTDGGKNWTHVWTQEGQIGTMAVHPKNADVAFAAVLGHAFGPNPERGVYRTRDGGKTWQQVLKKDSDTGASAVAIDPSNPNIVFAGLWQARRLPWDLVSGGPGSGLHVSRDGGDTWKELTTDDGLPKKPWGKVGVAVAPSDGDRIYALVEAEEGGLFRSDDGGKSWKKMTGDRRLRQRAWYYTTLTVHPTNKDEVWAPNVQMMQSIDGGATWNPAKGIHHGDHHDVWFDPANPKRMASANDGGADVSFDGGQSWSAVLMPIAQFYHVSADNHVPYRALGAMQDLGTASVPSNSLSSRGITRADWFDVGGGEAGHVVSPTSDPDIVYAGEYLGYISRYDQRTRQARNVSAWPDNPSGWPAGEMKYRFQWTAPIALSPHDPKVVYHGAQVLFRSNDGGQSWTAISPDLTTNDTSKQKWAGGPITGDNTGVETFTTIFAVAESPVQKDLIWAGSDDGLVHVTRDGGRSWTNVTKNVPGLPAFATVSLVEPSPHAAGTAYLVVDNHRQDDMKPYLWKTTDSGATWKSLSAALPKDVYLHAVREDPKRQGLLYLGTERGVMLSADDGGAWEPLKLNMPTVAVHDLVVKDNDLVVGTHGRSIWILDDLTPIRERQAQATSTSAFSTDPVRLFVPAQVTAWRYGYANRDRMSGQNPAPGLTFTYWLKAKPVGEITVEIRDARGRLVNTLGNVTKPDVGNQDPGRDEPKPELETGPGLHRATWNLRWAGAELVKNSKLDNGDPREGPPAGPGDYTLTLIVGDRRADARVHVVSDPRVKVTPAELDQQLALALEVREAITRLTTTINRLQGVRRQLVDRKTALGSSPKAQALVKAIDEWIAKSDALERKMHNPEAEVVYDILAARNGASAKLYSRLSPLLAWVTEAEGPPTEGARQVFAALAAEQKGYDEEAKTLLESNLGALQRLATEAGVGFVVVP